MHPLALQLFQGDHLRQDCAVNNKLDKFGSIFFIFLNYREEKRLVLEEVRPERKNSQSSWLEVFTVSQNVGKGAKDWVEPAGWEGAVTRRVSRPMP